MDDTTRRRFLQVKATTAAPVEEILAGLAAGPQQWVDAVGGASGQPLVTPREAAARVVAMEAAYASARSGRGVDVAA